jgi:uncharacterized membrane protein YqiK
MELLLISMSVQLVLWVLIGTFLLYTIYSAIVNVGGDELATLERRWIGREMSEGRTVALTGEVGVQAKILGPGLHFLIPYIFKATKHKYLVIRNNQIGIVYAITGNSIPQGQYMASSVDSNCFEDGEKFLTNGGQKGPQVSIIPPGEHRVNPHLFNVKIVNAVSVGDDEIAVVESIAGEPIEAGRIFAKPVDSDFFQNGELFLKNGGQKGPQISILTPGMYRINTELFQVEVRKATVVLGGHICLVTAMDGTQLPDGRLLADKVEGHSNFEIGETFIKNKGQKGRQIQHLMPGTYRINTNLFKISEPMPWTKIESDEVGIVTIQEGKSISDPTKIAADEMDMNIHQNFQDTDAFLKHGGQKGLQIPVLRAGAYAINPWFAQIKKQKMVEVQIGECAVVTNFVGEDGVDTSDMNVNAKIVENGKKGIWREPLGPGKHALNQDICKVDIVPTTQILLSWADDESSSHKFDANLKTITLRTADAFNVNMDVRVIIHIGMSDAPKVVANLGSVDNMISQVLEPAISSHFRNAAQAVQALELYTQRAEIQQRAKEHIQNVLKIHHIESKDTMIADVVLPIELTKTVTDRQIATQERATYKTQMEAQEERKKLENATAQADMQKQVVESERGVEISKNLADASIRKAEGESEAVKLQAAANAEAIKFKAGADAEAIEKTGNAEAGIILEKGKSTAESYKLQVDAMGTDNFGQLKIIEQIAQNNMKLIPETLIAGGGGSGSGNLENMMGVLLLEKLTGKKYADDKAEN